MYPPAWLTDRLSIQEDEVDGIRIPAQTLIAGFIYGTHHNSEYWENPHQFNPDRFSGDAKIHPFAFLPFGGGPRLCIGMQFALMEMKIVLRHLILNFDFKAMEPGLVHMKPLVTLGMSSNLPITLTSR